MVEKQDSIRHVFVIGLRNAHALEHQALALMDRQIKLRAAGEQASH